MSSDFARASFICVMASHIAEAVDCFLLAPVTRIPRVLADVGVVRGGHCGVLLPEVEGVPMDVSTDTSCASSV